ncbi:MAG: class I SAM-dependent methyltransferase, partial [bacterium]|nr:class I SAM-dependent methyltransferase [bacterium]
MPVLIGMLWPTRAAAQNCPKGDIRLFFCEECGFIFNPAFDPARVRYTEAYDNSLHFSPSYKAYAESMASGLIERHHIFDKNIIEIGCGKGDFLLLLSKLGNNQCIGFDPTFEKHNMDPQTEKQVIFIPDNYSEKYSHYKTDLICSRHVLEHILNPKDFIELTWNNIRKGSETVLYFEVPNVEFILRDVSVWDIIYEHCSYFGICSIAYLFKSCGFDVLDVAETFGRQFICI